MKNRKSIVKIICAFIVLAMTAALIPMIPAQHAKAATVESIAIKSITGNTYLVDDTPVTPQMVITVTYSDGTTEDLDLSETQGYVISPMPSGLSAGEYTGTVTYGGVSTEFPYLVIDYPSPVTAEYGQTFADVSIPASEYGTFAWYPNKLTEKVGDIGTRWLFNDYCYFTPTDSTYSSCSAPCQITVKKATPDDPVSISATYGQTLADVADQLPTSDSGTYAFEQDLSTSVGNAGTDTTSFTASFTASDTDHYNDVSGIKVIMNVAKAVPEVTDPLTVTAYYGQTLSDVPLPDGYSFEQSLSTSVGDVGLNTTSFTATYTPDDTANYSEVTGIKVYVNVLDSPAAGAAGIPPTGYGGGSMLPLLSALLATSGGLIVLLMRRKKI
ncbi:MAG: hypothetical protein ACOYJH_01325 [Anaerovoracaceae bacterium]